MTRVIAPGKLVLTGAYAVLEGAPAIVVAVDRYAVAEAGSSVVDVRALHDEGGRKLGLGSSAASVVALLGVRALARGDDLRDVQVRDRLFRAAREEHARAQGGGSGVDVAASVYGGALRYTTTASDAAIRAVDLPPGLVLRAFWSGTSARTSDLRARVDALRARDGVPVFAEMHRLAARASDAIDAADTLAFIAAAGQYGHCLESLGRAADAPIFPLPFLELARAAEVEGAAFLPSGAGGGDVAVWLGTASPSAAFDALAEARSMRPLAFSLDRGGLRPDSLSD